MSLSLVFIAKGAIQITSGGSGNLKTPSHCTSAFESGNAAELEDCFDPEIILFALQREYRGRKEVMDYLRTRFLQYAPKLSYKMKLDDVKLFGDALWYTYDYEIVSPKEHLIGRGMSMCRKDGCPGGRLYVRAPWKLLDPDFSKCEWRTRVRLNSDESSRLSV